MPEMTGLLTARDGAPVAIERADAKSDIVLICEHASALVPERLGDLGLSAELRQSHIAWDPGALSVAMMLSEMLDATLIYQRFSRLVYDCNRPPEASDSIPEISEIFEVPGNRGLTAAEKDVRTQALYIPFHAAIDRLLAERRAEGRDPVIVTIHSFTPVYKGVTRTVEIGILHDSDSRLADGMLAGVSGGYDVRRNEPYAPVDGVTHTLRRHALGENHLNVMIEIRNDLIADTVGQAAAAGFIAGLLGQCLAEEAA